MGNGDIGDAPPAAKPVKTNRYTCQRGHTIDIHGGTWITLVIEHSDQPRHEFNYCMVCFGEWAQAKWPLTCTEITA